MCRLRKGRANTGGAAHFLRETVSRVRYAGATGPLTARADSGFQPRHRCRLAIRVSASPLPFASTRACGTSSYPRRSGRPYWMEGAADVAETSYTPFASEPDAVPVRLIVRRVKPTPGSQLALFATYSFTLSSPTERVRCWNWRPTRRHAEIENAIRDLKYGVGLNHLHRAVSPPTPPGWPSKSSPTTWLAGPGALVWVSRWQPPRPSDDVSSPWPDASPARHAASPCISPGAGPGKTSSVPPWPDCAPYRSHPDGPRRLTCPR